MFRSNAYARACSAGVTPGVPLRSIGFVASNGLTVVGVVVLTEPITYSFDELPGKYVVAVIAAPAGALVEPALDDTFEPAVVGRAVDPFVFAVVEVDARFFACVAATRLLARTVEVVRSSAGRVVGALVLRCLAPLPHEAASARTPQTATTLTTPVLPMAAAYDKSSVGGTDPNRYRLNVSERAIRSAFTNRLRSRLMRRMRRRGAAMRCD